MRLLYFSRDYTTHDRRFLEALAKNNLKQDTKNEIFFLRLESSPFSFEERSLPKGVKAVEWEPEVYELPVPMPLSGYGNELDRVNAIKNVAGLELFNKLLAKIKPDLIQAGPIQTCAYLAAIADFHPLVSTSWGSDLLIEAGRIPESQQMTRFVLERSDALVGDCEPVRQKAIQYGMDPKKIVTFPWGIDLQQFKAQPYPSKQHGVFRFLSVRSWEPIYGVDLIIKALARAVQQISKDENLNNNLKLELVLLGNGSQETQLKELILQENIGDHIILAGRMQQDELPSLYASADLYVSASHSDGTSISLLEAMGSARAVLVSDIPGNREWITQDIEGWLFPDGDIQSLAEGMLEAIENRHLLPEMGRAARRKAEQDADWRKNFPKLLEAYQIAMHRDPKNLTI